MAVLVEAISVIVRLDAISDRYPGGWPAFRDNVPNRTLACDNEIARIGFMVPDDVRTFMQRLEVLGLSFLKSGRAVDVAVADQQSGISTACEWLQFGHVALNGNRIAACQMVGTESQQVFTPDGWQFEGSLSQTYTFVPERGLTKSMSLIEHRDGMDVYRSRLTDKLSYVGRVKDGQDRN
jgi:hypothetical protein